MERGQWDFIASNEVYRESKKAWGVECLSSTYFWFDPLIDPPHGIDLLSAMRTTLNELKTNVQGSLDRHFVYFLASREKIRFSTKKQPHYSLFGKLIVYIEVGRKRLEKKLILSAGNDRTHVECCERFITYHYSADHKVSYSVYDYLDLCRIQTGISSEVHYVGYTSNPSSRALDRNHRGFSDMVYRTSRTDEDYDYFIFYNLFKVSVKAIHPSNAIHFLVSNAMIDEVDIATEGKLLEKVLIKYFGTKVQELNIENEERELNNTLEKLATNKNIQSVTFDIEIEGESELFRFYSRCIEPNMKHTFSCQIGSSGAEIISSIPF